MDRLPGYKQHKSANPPNRVSTTSQTGLCRSGNTLVNSIQGFHSLMCSWSHTVNKVKSLGGMDSSLRSVWGALQKVGTQDVYLMPRFSVKLGRLISRAWDPWVFLVDALLMLWDQFSLIFYHPTVSFSLTCFMGFERKAFRWFWLAWPWRMWKPWHCPNLKFLLWKIVIIVCVSKNEMCNFHSILLRERDHCFNTEH